MHQHWERRIFDLEQLLEVSRALNSRLDTAQLIESICDIAMTHARVSEARLLLCDLRSPKMAALSRRDEFDVAISLPLSFRGRKVGELQLAEKIGGTPFLDSELEFLRDLTSLAAIAIENARLYELATIDRLTGLKNRGYFDARLEEEISRLRRQRGDLSLLLIDIDYFKRCNDTHGHLAGDEVLRQFASHLRESLRSSDRAFRYGGEEFVSILPATSTIGAVELAERLCRSVESLEFDYCEVAIAVTISIGVASCSSETLSFVTSIDLVAEDLLIRADRALYQAKANGRNRVAVVTDHDSTAPCAGPILS